MRSGGKITKKRRVTDRHRRRQPKQRPAYDVVVLLAQIGLVFEEFLAQRPQPLAQHGVRLRRRPHRSGVLTPESETKSQCSLGCSWVKR